eukprot:GHVL01011602.1.p1 GENE.GHVL01011602.1~~GHVL01011602.1.p1  ORF type:complete len:163 (-),score=37.00 GHVL01011602.1:407-895(-)
MLKLRINKASPWSIRWYSEMVHEHFNKPKNVGSLSKNDPNVGTATVGKASCGDVIKMQVEIQNGVVTDAKFKTFGCASAIASSSYATELVKGKKTDEAMSIKNTDISSHLSLPPVKIHCSLLAEDAIRAAITDWKKRNESSPHGGEGIYEVVSDGKHHPGGV